MSANPIFVDDEGTVFRLLIEEVVNNVSNPVDISNQTAMSFIFEKPDGTLFTRTPTFSQPPGAAGDGTDGQIEYLTLTGEIDEVGPWQLQAEVTLPTGTWRTEVVRFRVLEKLE